MKYEKIANYSGIKFQRITGVKRRTFEKMVEILKGGYAKKTSAKRTPPKAKHRRFAISNAGISARIPHLCPYCGQL